MNNTFFIVEDHHLMSHGITSWLTNNSHWTCAGSASNSIEAMEKLRILNQEDETRPSVVITDINLGDTSEDYSGIRLIKNICSEFPGINCICYSMYRSPGIIKMGIEAGAKGYISKSAGEKELIECMNQVQNGEKCIERNLVQSIRTYGEAVSSLTHKELEIMNLMMRHKTNDEISDILNIKKRTVETYTSRIYDKIGCKSRSELIEMFS